MSRALFRGLAAIFVAAAASLFLLGGAALAAGANDQDTGGWGKRTQGQPLSFQAGGTDGYYLWHDAGGLRLRTTDSAGKFRYSGTLRTNGAFINVVKVRDEADDHVDVQDGGKVIKFSFVTFQGIDGFNFEVSGGKGTWVHFRLDRDGSRIDPSNIFLGEDSVHPKHNPFGIVRHDDQSPTASASSTQTTTSTVSSTSSTASAAGR